MTGGIDRRLLNHLCEEARSWGAYKIYLYTSTTQDYVHRFYEALGFNRHGVSYRLDLDERVAA